jgi:hypothetical protein
MGERFTAEVLLSGKTATGVEVPPEVVDALGGGRRPLVAVTIGGHTYRSAVAVMGGKYMLGINADVREAAHVAAGDKIDVDVTLDTAPREVPVPTEVAAFFNTDAEAKTWFDGLSYSKRYLIVGTIDGAKTPETRQKRVDAALGMLHARKV